MAIRLDRTAVRVGDEVSGVVELAAPAACRVRSVRVEARGRELIGAPPRYRPPVYACPVPRPWGRTRTGAARTDFELSGELLDRPPVALPAGSHLFPFRFPLPLSALPTYGGMHATVEHEVTARIELQDGETVEGWAPLHLWQAAAEPGPASPVTVEQPPGEAAGRLASLLRGWLAPVGLRVELADARLLLGGDLALRWAVDNPDGLDLRRLEVGLDAVETSRHRAATEVIRFSVAGWQVPLGNQRNSAGELARPLPRLLAPSLAGRRFRLDWRLTVAVRLPWRIGASLEIPVTVSDATGTVSGDRAR